MARGEIKEGEGYVITGYAVGSIAMGGGGSAAGASEIKAECAITTCGVITRRWGVHCILHCGMRNNSHSL